MAGSTFMGLVIGLKYSVLVIGLAAPVFAAIAAVLLRDLGFVAAAVITFACLTMSQIGYLAGAWLRSRHAESSDTSSSSQQSNNSNGDNRQSRIPGEQSNQGNPPSHSAN